ncbi:hypothetical protein ABMA27_012038 [Loxostege sticticalis]|uniref:Secreted protein n=1 Tax=Loxostege sticticalis TaxID=481309 RepID=A0ABR3IIG7_LOXSC
MRVQALLVACCALTGVTSAAGNSTSDRHRAIAQAMLLSIDWPETEPYVESLKMVARNGAALKALLPHEKLPVTDPRRHYVLFAGVLAHMVEYLKSDCTPPDYEHEYLPAVDVLVPEIWKNPSVAVGKVESFLMAANKTVQQIQDIADLHCQNLHESICNRVLKAIASESDDLDKTLELVFMIGELAAIYENNRYVEEAEKYNTVGLLIGGKEKLKPLVFKAAEVYNKLYGRHCES